MNLQIINHDIMKISKWIVSARNKLKMVLAVTTVAGLLFVANMFEQEQVASIDESFLSIYADHLVPATTIFEIGNNYIKNKTC